MLIRTLAEPKPNRNELIKVYKAVLVKHLCRYEIQLTMSGGSGKGTCPYL